jgi:hypothetical protein
LVIDRVALLVVAQHKTERGTARGFSIGSTPSAWRGTRIAGRPIAWPLNCAENLLPYLGRIANAPTRHCDHLFRNDLGEWIIAIREFKVDQQVL